MMEGVSFIVPVHNGAAWIRDTLRAILSQADFQAWPILTKDAIRTNRSEMRGAQPAWLVGEMTDLPTRPMAYLAETTPLGYAI